MRSCTNKKQRTLQHLMALKCNELSAVSLCSLFQSYLHNINTVAHLLPSCGSEGHRHHFRGTAIVPTTANFTNIKSSIPHGYFRTFEIQLFQLISIYECTPLCLSKRPINAASDKEQWAALV